MCLRKQSIHKRTQSWAISFHLHLHLWPWTIYCYYHTRSCSCSLATITRGNIRPILPRVAPISGTGYATHAARAVRATGDLPIGFARRQIKFNKSSFNYKPRLNLTRVIHWNISNDRANKARTHECVWVTVTGCSGDYISF